MNFYLDEQTKHYIRINEDRQVVYGFSTAFEEPLENDICINENAERQFKLLDEYNPNLLDERNCHRFIYEEIETEVKIPVEKDEVGNTDDIIIESDVDENVEPIEQTDVVIGTEDITDSTDIENQEEETTEENSEDVIEEDTDEEQYITQIKITYELRYATQEELDAEYSAQEKPEEIPIVSLDDKVTDLENQLATLQSTNDMLTECLLEMSEVVYSVN